MSRQANLPDSLNRILKYGKDMSSGKINWKRWVEWFNDPGLRKGRLNLVRGGEDTFATNIRKAFIDNEGIFHLNVDRLIPEPDFIPEREIVAFHGKLVHMDEGMEVTTVFSAVLGSTFEEDDEKVFDLIDFQDLDVQSEEYVANIPKSRKVELGMVWFGEWKQIRVEQATISRLFFDKDLEGVIGVDGYAVPKATLTLDPDLPSIPVRLQVYKRPRPKFEATIEKIDSIAMTKLTTIIEEIWQIESGLSQRYGKAKVKEEVGYMSKEHDSLAEAFDPHILYLGRDENMRNKLSQFGKVMIVRTNNVDVASKDVMDIQRCDLVVGDAEHWGQEAIKVERMLRSIPRVKDSARLWLSEMREDQVDLREFGAFDMVNKYEDKNVFDERLKWAISGDSTGGGLTMLLLSDNNRLRYRFGVALTSYQRRLVYIKHNTGLLRVLDREKPMWILVDSDLFGDDLGAVLKPIVAWTQNFGSEIILLSRGLSPQDALHWLKAGVNDLVVVDPPLHGAVQRLSAKIYGE